MLRNGEKTMSNKTSTVNIRMLALEALMLVLEEKKTSSEVFRGVLDKYQYLPKQERAFFTRLCEGTMERTIELDYVINQFSKVKTRKMKPAIRTILRMGTYQILYMSQVPDSAACNESVKLASKKGFHTLKGFVNGILRNISRNREDIKYPSKDKDFLSYLNITYSMPMWILEKWSKTYSKEEIETILTYFAKERVTTIRINTKKTDRDAYVKQLIEEGIKVTPGAYYENAFYITGYNSIQNLPGYEEGYFVVQDESSMLAVLCAGLNKGMQVLDVCAAPGGKTMFAASLVGDNGKVTACDLSEHKALRIQENVNRMGLLNVEVNVWDATQKCEDWVNSMDVVIADVPCSGLGVIGKKSDIKYNSSQEGIDQLVSIQRDILTNVQQYVKPGGVLLFSTCTVAKEENQDNAEWFLKNFDFTLESLVPYLPQELATTTANEGYLQLVPGVHQTDGFFIARFRKRT